MKICPDCQSPVENYRCTSCGWTVEIIEGVASYLSTADRTTQECWGYIENYSKIASRDLVSPFMPEDYTRELAERIAAVVGTLDGKTVCDVGSGMGYLTAALLKNGARQVVAVDIAVEYLRRLLHFPGVEPVLANVEKLPFRDHFDVIICTDVLEHVLNISAAMWSFNLAIKTGGRLVVRVPYRENLMSYAPQARCPFKFVHIRAFDRAILTGLMVDAGFCVKQVLFDGYDTDIPARFWNSTKPGLSMWGRLSFLRRWLSMISINMPSIWYRPREIVIESFKERDLSSSEEYAWR